jgi:hypothetical protein
LQDEHHDFIITSFSAELISKSEGLSRAEIEVHNPDQKFKTLSIRGFLYFADDTEQSADSKIIVAPLQLGPQSLYKMQKRKISIGFQWETMTREDFKASHFDHFHPHLNHQLFYFSHFDHYNGPLKTIEISSENMKSTYPRPSF